MSRTERALAILLRITGLVLLLALGTMVMPSAWMAATHRWLALGELPTLPVVIYMARSLSLLYATMGALLIFLSSDVRRYGPMIGFIGWIHILGGAIQLGIDFATQLPGWWIAGDGPPIIALGTVIVLMRQAAITAARRIDAPTPVRNAT